jgi:YVTN family beta-propeller protein
VKRSRAIIICLSALCACLLGIFPHAARADGGAPDLAYVAGGGAGGEELTVIAIAQRKVTEHIHLGGDPWGVLLSLDSRFAYVTLNKANQLAIVDAHAQKIVATLPTGPSPKGLALDASHSSKVALYVANSGGNTVTVIDPDTRRVLATAQVGEHPTGVAVAGPGSGIADPNTPEIYVANSDSDSVTVISGKTYQPITEIPVSGGPVSVVVPATGGVAYVATRSGDIDGIDLADHSILPVLYHSDGSSFGTMDYNAITGQVSVPDGRNNAVIVLTPATAGGPGITPRIPNEPSRILPYDGHPTAIAITFDGSYAFVAEQNAGAVAMVDVPTHKTLATLAVGGTPRGLVTGAFAPVLNRQTASILEYVISGSILAVIAAILIVIWRRAQKGEVADEKQAAVQK